MMKVACSALIVMLALLVASAQQQAPAGGRGRGGFLSIGVPVAPLGDGPFIIDTAEQHKIRVVVMTKALSHPWSIAFLPDGSMLVTERAGRLRIIRNGVLDPQPIAGLPTIHARVLAGLMDVVLHPRFAENKLLYLAYSKPGEKGATTAVARARWDGSAIVDVKDVFVADAWLSGTGPADASFGCRIAFGRDGMMYVALGDRNTPQGGQNPGDHLGKIVRLRDDGTVPPDNPFVGKPGYKPEIYSLGHRNQQGLAVHPETGALWETEQGPNGGDEVNIILPGRNYGWPLVFWVPSIATSGMAFYTGDRFPAWRGNVLVGALRQGEIPGTGHIERIVFNNNEEELRRESLLTELRQRIRDIRQGPDGLLYVLTEEEQGALLRIEPAS